MQHVPGQLGVVAHDRNEVEVQSSSLCGDIVVSCVTFGSSRPLLLLIRVSNLSSVQELLVSSI